MRTQIGLQLRDARRAPPLPARAACACGSPLRASAPSSHPVAAPDRARHPSSPTQRPLQQPAAAQPPTCRRHRRGAVTPAAALSPDHLPCAMPFLTQEETWALALTTFAGLSTCIGAAFAVRALGGCSRGAALPPPLRPPRLTLPCPAAPRDAQVVRQPDDALLALLLGNAIGVMLLLSVWEMWLHNAAQHGWPEISLAFALGALLYQVVQPWIPELGTHHLEEPGQAHHTELNKVCRRRQRPKACTPCHAVACARWQAARCACCADLRCAPTSPPAPHLPAAVVR